MNYDNLSPALAMIAVQLSAPATFQKIVGGAGKRLAKQLPRSRKNRLK